MSNGVEVIVATDRNARPLEPEFLRLLSSTVTRPITLAPHTLSNLMSMVLSSEEVTDGHSHFMSLLRPTFTTKTYYTTYNYKTISKKNNSTVVSSAQTTVTNLKTEPMYSSTGQNEMDKRSRTVSVDASPTLQAEVFNTEYTYVNTFMDGDQPLIVSETHTVSNTIVGDPDVKHSFLNELEPSEVFPKTNTYLKTVELTKTLTDGTDRRVTSTRDVVTQVVVTDKPSKRSTGLPITANVTKTYFVTYTYFSTYLEGDKTQVKSDVSVSSEITVEKFYIKTKPTESRSVSGTGRPVRATQTTFPFNLLATKTYLTTFTYYTTLLHGSSDEDVKTKVNSRTRVVEKTVTETIPHANFKSEYLQKLNSSLQRITGSIVTTATLAKGDTVVVTAYKNAAPFQMTNEIEPTKTTTQQKTVWNHAVEVPGVLSNDVSVGKSSPDLLKSKITLIKTSKSVLNEPMAEALIGSPEDSYMSITPTATFSTSAPTSSQVQKQNEVKHGAHGSAGSAAGSSHHVAATTVTSGVQQQEAQHKDTESAASESQTTTATSDDTSQKPKPQTNQTNVNGLLNTFGGINVLGPVFNAMAELINNKINYKNADAISRRNDTVTTDHEPAVKKPVTTNANPILQFVNKFTAGPVKATGEPKSKPTTPRTPVYIPVGSFGEETTPVENPNSRVLIAADTDEWYEKWKNIHDKNFDKVRPSDAPVTILEGGIPISPGQVITTNSDVIIGRPGGSGVVRPPNFAVKNSIPLDMKPPPVPPNLFAVGDGDHYVGQHSTNKGVNYKYIKDDLASGPSGVLITSQKHIHDVQGLKVSRHPNDRHKGAGVHGLKHQQVTKNVNLKYDSGTADLNPPPVPPPPVRSHDVHRPVTVNHKPHKQYPPHYHKPTKNVIPVPVGLGDSPHTGDAFIQAAEINPTVLTVSPLPAGGPHHHAGVPLIGQPTPNLDVVNAGGILFVPTVGDPETGLNPNLVDRSTAHPFLVNIQPSQVANIVIPHGSSTALIVGGNEQHSLKGEVIDDPSPHPEPETVGFVGAEPVIKLENDDLATAVHNEVIPAETVEAPKTSSQLNGLLVANRPLLQVHGKPFGDFDISGQEFSSAQNPYTNAGQNVQFAHQSPALNLNKPHNFQQGSAFYGHQQQQHQQQQQQDVQKPNGDSDDVHGQNNVHLEDQTPGSSYINQKINFNAQNVVKEITQADLQKNYRKEQNVHHGGFKGSFESQKVFAGSPFQHGPGPQSQNLQLGPDNVFADSIRFGQHQNVQNVQNGEIFVGTLSPDHLPLRPDLNPALQESLHDHQSGTVQDVPLPIHVKPTNGHHRNEPGHQPKDVLVDQSPKPSEGSVSHGPNLVPQFFENQNSIKRPADDFSGDLSPPPPPRPTFVSGNEGPNLQKPPQRYPGIHSAHQPVPTPLDFMIPPPETPSRLKPKLQDQTDPHIRPVIPIGAMGPLQNYPHLRPEDMVIVPHKNRPGFVEAGFVNQIKHHHQIPPSPNVYYDLDVSDSSRPFKTETGDQIPEPGSRPPFPTHAPNDPIQFSKNVSGHLNNHKTSNHPKPGSTPDTGPNHLPKGGPGSPGTIVYATPGIDQALTNISNHLFNGNHGSTKQNEFVQAGSAHFGDSSIQGTSNNGQVANAGGTTKQQQHGFKNHKDSYGFSNHKETSDAFNNPDQTSSFESLKIPGFRHPTGGETGNNKRPTNAPTNFHNKVSGSGGKTVTPSANPSGFSKADNSASNIDQNLSGGSKGNSQGSDSTKIKEPTYNNHRNSSESDSLGQSSIQSESLSNELFYRGQDPTREPSTPHKPTELSQSNKFGERPKPPSGFVHHQTSGPGHNNNNKQPVRYDPKKPAFGTKQQPNVILHNHTRPGAGPGVAIHHGRPLKNPTQAPGGIKNHRNKVPVGYPNTPNEPGLNVGSRPKPPVGSIGQGSVQIKRPSGFTLPTEKEDTNKIYSNKGSSSSGTNIKKVSNDSSYDDSFGHAAGVGVANGFPGKNESSGIRNPGQGYGDGSTNFYEPKPTFDVTKVQNSFNKDADNWFASNFNNNKNNHNHNVSNHAVGNQLAPVGSHRNVTHGFPPQIGPVGSELEMTLMTPPKVTDVKSEEVMGLSPPPMERPRRPQRPHRPPSPPQRPKPLYIPTTPKPSGSPINMENDFPPVRSPEFTRKPLNPQDIFPPRLPDNFVHHLPNYPIRQPPNAHSPEKPITSLPIDVPTTGSTGKPSHYYVSPNDYDENTAGDPLFAGSEINGHSKPIGEDVDGGNTRKKLPPPNFNSNKYKPGSPADSHGSSHQQPGKAKTTERPNRPETTSQQNKQSGATSPKRGDISPTSTTDISPEMSTESQKSKSRVPVTPAATEPYTEWQEGDLITGSETAFDPDVLNGRVTPPISSVTDGRKVVTTLLTTGSTTIFGNMFTQNPNQILEVDSKLSTEVYDNEESASEEEEYVHEGGNSGELQQTSLAVKPTITPTRTTTLTVTTTMTTVVHSIGHKPFTKTIVLTTTLISTVINKVTETRTLLKPTTSTLTQTHTIATTKTALVVPTALYPSHTKYPTGGTLKPEIFVADPHAKDTMTISVSSSMNGNNKHNNGSDQPARPLAGGKDSIMVVVSDDHSHSDVSEDDMSDEDTDSKHNNVLVGGVFAGNVNSEFSDASGKVDECFPGCKAKKNELCQRIAGVLKCVCRPGFARMFPDRPCRPTYTYKVKLALEKLGPEQINYEKNVAQANSANMAKLTSVTKEGLDRMIMQSELRDIYHGVVLNGFQNKEKKTMADFYVQLSENTNEEKLMKIFKQSLQTSNYSLGGTELFAAREADNLDAEDFNECLNAKFHDCSEHARCFNLKGTYTCSCKEGYTDVSENSLFPGRVCSDTIGCEYCGYHGACYSKGEGQITCECFQWYSGERCNINLKVLLIALVTIGAILLALLLVCAVLTCLNKGSRGSSTTRNNGYLRYRGPSSHSIDRRAMIGDSSSESSVDNVPYLTSPPMPTTATMNPKKKSVLRHVKGPVPRTLPPPGLEQRSVTVMIPRAKYRPVPPLSPHLTMSTFSPEKHLPKAAPQVATEQKLISYLDGNTRDDRSIAITKNQSSRQESEQQQHRNYNFKSSSMANLTDSPRAVDKKLDSRVFEYEYKMSNMIFSDETNSAERRSGKSIDDRFRRHSDSTHLHTETSRAMQFRKYSAGALVSAGYEVSAKVGMHQLDDDADDNSGILNTHTMKSNRSQFTTLNRTGDHKTISEARSYDETTVHPQTRSLKTHYSGSSPSSRANNDEGHTMIERDLGSTFIMPESQLFKPEADRGSDISNFDSL